MIMLMYQSERLLLADDPIEDFVSYHPNIGASDDELTKICDDIYQTLMGAFVAQMHGGMVMTLATI